jgi:hypothetical protein
LAQLRFLLLGDCDNLEDITSIHQWANTLSGIYLQARNLKHYHPLGELQNLTFANLAWVPIMDLSFVANLSKLNLLHLGGSAKLPDLEPLLALPELKHLFLYAGHDIDLMPLRGKENLTVHIRVPDHVKVRGAKFLGHGSRVTRVKF